MNSNGRVPIPARRRAIRSLFRAGAILSLSLWAPAIGRGQDSLPVKLTLAEAVEKASRDFPAIRAARAEAKVAGAGVEAARTPYLPRADLLWQENRATRNNVFGLLLPQSTLPSISGPDLEARTMQSAWGSAGGLLLSWEPIDFGLRKAGLDQARALARQAEANEAVARLEAGVAAADAFLALAAAGQAVAAARAGVERAETISKAVLALVAQELRPGVDAARAEAELAGARNLLIRAEQEAELARAALGEAIGQPGAAVDIDPGRLLGPPPEAGRPGVNFQLHPVSLAQTALIDAARAREKVAEKSWAPRINWQTAVFGRGTGARLDGTFSNSRGWYPDTFNWATGVTVTFPVLDFFGMRARKRAEAGRAEAEEARREQLVNSLKTQDARARTLVDAARRIAVNTAVQARAAREALEKARVRYEYGLTNITEVADAQRLLVQSEIDNAVAGLSVWRALLAAARIDGDLAPLVRLASGGGR